MKLLGGLLSIHWWVLGITAFICGGTVMLLMSLLLSPSRLQPLTYAVCWLIMTSSGHPVRVKNKGPDKDEGPYVYVFNHTSLLDAFTLMVAIREWPAVVGKIEQFSVPFWGWLLRRWNVVGIDRSDRESSIKRFASLQQSLERGQSALVAPEGTRGKDGQLGPFKKGPFHLAMDTGSPVCPVLIRGAFEAKNPGSFALRPGVITVEFLPIVSVDESQSVDELRDATRARYDQALSVQD